MSLKEKLRALRKEVLDEQRELRWQEMDEETRAEITARREAREARWEEIRKLTLQKVRSGDFRPRY